MLRHTNPEISSRNIFEAHQALYHELNTEVISEDNKLAVANSIAIQKDANIRESFLNNLTTYFHTQMFLEDFVNNGAKAVNDINSWVAEKTHHKIEKLVDNIDAATKVILMNAIYFKGTWHYEFDKNKTKIETFRVNEKMGLGVPMMHTTAHLNWASFSDGQMVELPYKDNKLSMFVFLPQSMSTLSSESMFNSDVLKQRIKQLENTTVILSMPRFTIEAKYSLGTTLNSLGMNEAFQAGKADFSNIDGQRDLVISDIMHKTFIEVNEEGSEAAAVTGVIFETTSIHTHPTRVNFNVDHPFLFFIRDNVHQVTLFSGVVNTPSF